MTPLESKVKQAAVALVSRGIFPSVAAIVARMGGPGQVVPNRVQLARTALAARGEFPRHDLNPAIHQDPGSRPRSRSCPDNSGPFAADVRRIARLRRQQRTLIRQQREGGR